MQTQLHVNALGRGSRWWEDDLSDLNWSQGFPGDGVGVYMGPAPSLTQMDSCLKARGERRLYPCCIFLKFCHCTPRDVQVGADNVLY